MLTEHRIREGMAVSDADRALIPRKEEFQEMQKEYRESPTNFIDVTSKLQSIVDGYKEGTYFMIDKNHFDANAVFSNPIPGRRKLLEFRLHCQGHDSERLTDSSETTSGGNPRNFIMSASRYFCIEIIDDKYSRGILQESPEFQMTFSSPLIQVTRATYGLLNDSTKVIDVTPEVQNFVKGRVLRIDGEVKLDEVFPYDPAPGIRKQLRIDYCTKGFAGNLRVREKKGFLSAAMELGFQPIPPRDDYEDEYN
jgi:hypothetical protein